MPVVKIYRHKDCVRCEKVARVHRMFDWLGRLDYSTETPPTGPLKLGEIAVEDLRTGRSFTESMPSGSFSGKCRPTCRSARSSEFRRSPAR